MMLALAGGLFISCERHEFDGPKGTKQLNEPHGHGAHGADAAHGDGHEKEKEAH
jgi:hypothetical protein